MKIIKLIISLLFFISINLNSQSVIFQVGDDFLEGNVTVGMQYKYFKGTFGLNPTTMPHSGDLVGGWCWAVTLESSKVMDSGFYLSLGRNTAGWKDEERISGNMYINKSIEPMWGSMVGYRLIETSGFYLKNGIGWAWCEYGNNFIYGMAAGWTF